MKTANIVQTANSAGSMTVYPQPAFARDSASGISRLFIMDLVVLQDPLFMLKGSLLVTDYKIQWRGRKKKMFALATSAWQYFKLNVAELKDRGDGSVSILSCELFGML